MASPSLTNSTDQFKYDVFVSFRGFDTRSTFVSHLYQAFKSQGIRVFVDETLNRRDNESHKTLCRIREESEIFLIIFSGNYASSAECLDELVEIMMLRETKNRLVIPVFYGLDSGDLVYRFEKDMFNRHIEMGMDRNTVERWGDTLRLASEISGWSTTDGEEGRVLDEIVRHVWKILDQPSQNPTDQHNWSYDVFVSFVKADCGNFVSHLCRALTDQDFSVYKNVDAVPLGGVFADEIFKAIKASKISVVVFSRNYAFSSDYLDELRLIMELHETKGHIVIPIFYRDLEDCEHWVQEALLRHRRGGFEDKVPIWRDAWKRACQLHGFVSTHHRDESEFIADVVQQIWKYLDRPSQGYPVKAVAVPFGSRINDIISLLQMGSSDVRTIGIRGEGGRGKTTIAKALFRQIWDQFERFYFFTNIKEEVKRSVLSHLQDKLLSGSLDVQNLNMESPDFWLAFKKNQVHDTKVLLILDDIDDANQINKLVAARNELFGSGSRILITSSCDSVLQNLDAIYSVERLKDRESERLFRSIALFTINHVKLQKFLKYANGNLLAVRVLGSALRHMSESEWDVAMEKLEKLPVSIHSVLRYSYGTLDEEEKKVFLDVACFFVGQRWDHVTEVLGSHYSSIRVILHALLDRALISISHEKLEMHDLLQEMAWTIVIEEISTNPGKRSNLWNPENLYHLLKRQKGWMMLGCSSSLCLISL